MYLLTDAGGGKKPTGPFFFFCVAILCVRGIRHISILQVLPPPPLSRLPPQTHAVQENHTLLCCTTARAGGLPAHAAECRCQSFLPPFSFSFFRPIAPTFSF